MHGKAEGDSGVSRQGTAEYLQHERLTALKASNIPATKSTVYEMTIVNQLPVCNDGNLHSRAQVVSEDEMSAVSAGIIFEFRTSPIKVTDILGVNSYLK